MVLTNVQRAQVLVEALPYIQQYYGRIVVIKQGGSAMRDPELRQDVMGDIALLSSIGIKVVLVHEGGCRSVDGSETYGTTLVSQLCRMGVRSIGLSGIDGSMLEVEPPKKELSCAEGISNVDPAPILDILEKGYLPVISAMGQDKKGHVYNVDSHTAAARIAGSLKAENMILMTDAAGVLKDKNDPKSLISVMNVSEVNEYIKTEIITGDMISRVNCCVEAIRWGVKRVVIVDGRTSHSILMEILTDEGIGTMFR